MLRILDKDKVPVKGLQSYKDLCVKKELDLDMKTLTFTAPLREVRDIIVPEGYIETKEDRFVIKEVIPSTKGTMKVTAKLDVEALEGAVFRSFQSSTQTVEDCLQLAFAGTGWTVAYSEITKRRTISMTNVTAWEVLEQALSTYTAEVEIDSKNQTVSIYEQRGEDKGAYFSSQLNLTSLEVTSDSYDFYTELEAYGKDGMTFADINDGNNYVTNYQYSTKKKRYLWKDERYTIAENLLEDAISKLEDMSRPYTSYETEIIDLARASGGQYSILEFDIGDTITIIDGITGTREKQRIVVLKQYPEEPDRRDTCTLSNVALTLDEVASTYESTADTVDNITNDNGTVDGDAIDGIYSDQIYDLDAAVIGEAVITDLIAQYVEVSGELTAVKATIGELEANVATIEAAVIGKLDADEAYITFAQIADLNAANAQIGILEANYANIEALITDQLAAVQANIEQLTANIATINQAVVGKLDANEAYITFAQITDLNAASAQISVLEANYANIESLLAGNAGVGNLQTIYLTADNTVIDSALIRNAVIQNITASDILAGRISTDEFIIASDDGGLTISGNTMQFTDADDVVRIQIGQDASGNFTFVLYDETGTGVLIDSEGIKASAIGDGLIVDDMVAADAGISGSKLDIVSLYEAMNGSTEVLYSSRIWFDEESQSLTQIYAQMSETITGVQTTVDNLEVGGVNRALGTAEPVSITGNGSENQTKSIYYMANSLFEDIGERETFTISFDVEIDGDREGTLRIQGTYPGYPILYSSTSLSEMGSHVSSTNAQSRDTNRLAIRLDNVPETTTITISNLKLEKGNVATDWSPAPEDTDSAISDVSDAVTTVQTTVTSIVTSIDGINVDIASLTSTVSAQESLLSAQQTSLSVLQGNISAIISESELTEVSSTSTMYSKLAALILEVDGLTLQFSDLSTSYDTLSGQYTAMDSRMATFELSLDGLSTTISSVQSSFDNLSIGGRNLQLGSKDWADSAFYRLGDGTISDGVLTVPIGSTDTETHFIDVSPGDVYTVSFDIKSTTTYSGNTVLIEFFDESGTRLSYSYITGDVTTEWQRISSTFTVPDDGTAQMRFGMRSREYQNSYRLLKVERGNVATDWTPAPEDAESSIETVQSAVTSIVTSIDGINVDIASLTSTVSAQADILTAQQTSLSVLQGNISAIISESELTEISSASTMYSKLAALILEVDGLTLQFSDLSTSYDTLSGQYTAMDSRMATFELSLDGLSTTISSVQSDFDNLSIGGRNLLMDSNAPSLSAVAASQPRRFQDALTSSNNYEVSYIAISDAPQGIEYGAQITVITAAASDNYRGFLFYTSVAPELTDGETYTASWYARCTDGTAYTRFELYSHHNSTATLTTSDWQRYSYTFTFDDSVASSTPYAMFQTNCAYVGTIQMCGFKLEKGNVATDWTPAPEDVDTSITNVSSQLATLILEVDGLTLQFSDLSTSYDTLSGQYTAMDSRMATFELSLDGLSTTVSSVQSSFDNLSIGGRNLQLGSKDWADSAFYSVGDGTISDGVLTVPVGSTNVETHLIEVSSGDVYTVSFDIKSTTTYSGNTVLVEFFDESGTRISYSYITGDVTTEWQRISSTFTVPDDGTAQMRFGMRSREYQNSYRLLKVERGNVATDWTPAPEDAEDRLDELETWQSEASLKITDSSIISTVISSSSYETSVESIISQNASSIRMMATTLEWTSTYSSMTANGTLTAQNANIIGTITASDGAIGGWTIIENALYQTSVDEDGEEYYSVLRVPRYGNYSIGIGASNLNDLSTSPFRVAYDGRLYTQKMFLDQVDSCLYARSGISEDASDFVEGQQWIRAICGPYRDEDPDTAIHIAPGGGNIILSGIHRVHSNGIALSGLVQCTTLDDYATTTTAYAGFDSSGYLKKWGSSSRRYKHDIQDLTDFSYEDVLKIPVRQFVYNDGYLTEGDPCENKTIPGLIAEEVGEIFPVAAISTQDGEYENWNDRMILVMLLKTVQEQQKQIRELEARCTEAAVGRDTLLATVSVARAVVQSLDDEAAVQAKALFEDWEDAIGETADMGFKFRYSGELYKTIQETTEITADNVPGEGTEDIYENIG